MVWAHTGYGILHTELCTALCTRYSQGYPHVNPSFIHRVDCRLGYRNPDNCVNHTLLSKRVVSHQLNTQHNNPVENVVTFVVYAHTYRVITLRLTRVLFCVMIMSGGGFTPCFGCLVGRFALAKHLITLRLTRVLLSGTFESG